MSDISSRINSSQFAIQDQVVLGSEAAYNKMSEAMTAFHNKLFKKYHKPSYSEEDIAVLDEYRTVANVGMVSQPKKTKTIELGISKAYAAAFSNITKIPIFNELDIWKPYDGSHLQDLNLDVVKARGQTTLLFNKT